MLPILATDVQGLLDYSNAIIDTGEELMFTMDIPSVPAQSTPVVLVQAGASASAPPADGSQQADYLLKMCEEKSSADESNVPNLVDISSAVVVELGNREHRDIDPAKAITKVTLLETTKQGNLIQKITKDGKGYFIYEPISGYEGKDKATFMVEYAGKHYKVELTLLVSRSVDTNSPLCPATPQFIPLNPKPASSSSGYQSSGSGLTFYIQKCQM